jgi:hypothetical protein
VRWVHCVADPGSVHAGWDDVRFLEVLVDDTVRLAGRPIVEAATERRPNGGAAADAW